MWVTSAERLEKTTHIWIGTEFSSPSQTFLMKSNCKPTNSIQKHTASCYSCLVSQSHKTCKYLLHCCLTNAGKTQICSFNSLSMQSMHMSQGKIKHFRLPNAIEGSDKFLICQMSFQLWLMFGRLPKCFRRSSICLRLACTLKLGNYLISRLHSALNICCLHSA